MKFCKIIAAKPLILSLLFLLSYTFLNAQNGQQLFAANCQTCHSITKDMTGPALQGVLTRGPWAVDRKNTHDWVHNPAAFMAKDPYPQALKAKFGTMMTAFPQLTDKEIDAILDYVNVPPAPSTGGGDNKGGGGEDSGNGALIFGLVSLVLAIVALILMQVNSNLKKLSDDKERIQRPEQVPFYKNKIYIALIAVLVFVIAGYFIATNAIVLGRQQGYSPTQPIYYSHKVHAGINQINCLYCHGGAWESKHAGIPSLNICMNCHKVISSYEKGPKLLDEEGNEINGTAEIQKLYKYAGYTQNPQHIWDPSKGTSPQWVKIHNLPDHVYFNHSQHVRVGNVACQTCHGNIQEMDKVQQKAELSMGWCINCHRETKVNFNYTDSTGNKFYSIYEKFHNDIKQGKMDSVTVKDIGGIECQKCHY